MSFPSHLPTCAAKGSRESPVSLTGDSLDDGVSTAISCPSVERHPHDRAPLKYERLQGPLAHSKSIDDSRCRVAGAEQVLGTLQVPFGAQPYLQVARSVVSEALYVPGEVGDEVNLGRVKREVD